MLQLRKPLLVSVIAAVLLTACGTMKVGRDFNYNDFASRVQRGTTTERDLAEWLGPPAGRGVELNADGTRLQVLTYYYGQAKIGSQSGREFKLLQVKVDEQGKVASYIWSGDLAGGTAVEDKSTGK